MEWIAGWIAYLLTSWVFWIFYMIPSYLMAYYGLKTLKPLIPKNQEERDRDEKYHAFRRHDLDKISYVSVYL